METRLNRLRGILVERELDALIVADILNVRYLSGFTGSYAVLLVTSDTAFLLTDGRYMEQAAMESPGCILELIEISWVPTMLKLFERVEARRIGFEDHALDYRTWSELSSGTEGVALVPTDNLVENLRMVKDEGEISAIRNAARVTDEAFTHVLTFLKSGLSETEIALEIDFAMRKLGAEKEGFETLVASGPRSALPHGKPTSRIVSEGDLVLMDFGARCDGYHADITRCVVPGRPDLRQEEVYSVVLEAQRRAIEAIHPGVQGRAIDSVAREFIASRGFGEYFTHSLGHGLGLAVHDARVLTKQSNIVLQPGMVVTVEPGIYIPGWGGIRIEDDVLVTNTGCEVLTSSSRQLGF